MSVGKGWCQKEVIIRDTIWYTVKNGDVLSKIAFEYNTTVDSLCRWNNINRFNKYDENGERRKHPQTYSKDIDELRLNHIRIGEKLIVGYVYLPINEPESLLSQLHPNDITASYDEFRENDAKITVWLILSTLITIGEFVLLLLTAQKLKRERSERHHTLERKFIYDDKIIKLNDTILKLTQENKMLDAKNHNNEASFHKRIHEKDERINMLEKRIYDNDKRIHEKDERINMLEKRIYDNDKQIHEKNIQINMLEKRIHDNEALFHLPIKRNQ